MTRIDLVEIRAHADAVAFLAASDDERELAEKTLALLAEVERLTEAIAAWERGSYWAQKKIDRRTRERDALAAKVERVALLAHQVEDVPVHAGGGNLVTRRRMLPEDALNAALADPKEGAYQNPTTGSYTIFLPKDARTGTFKAPKEDT